jgi:predicted HTH transcriptional regulator
MTAQAFEYLMENGKATRLRIAIECHCTKEEAEQALEDLVAQGVAHCFLYRGKVKIYYI